MNLEEARCIHHGEGDEPPTPSVRSEMNVTVFPEVREAYLDLVVRWAGEPASD